MINMGKCRYIALTDINPSCLPRAEKDDIQSLIRLLLYTNEIDVEGIILCSSCFLKRGGGKQAAAIVSQILDAYDSIKSNLDHNSGGYPDTQRLRKVVHLGIPAYGQSPGRGFAEKRYQDNPGVQQIIRAVDASDPRPVWIGLWGGANTLAQAIWQVSRTRSGAELDAFLRKLRIHAISDQDNSGKWLRREYGDRLFYIVTPSPGTVAGIKEYFRAVWPGISADQNGHGSEDGIRGGGFSGADKELIGEPWLDRHIRARGPLGRLYPKTVYIMEGDTPAFPGLLPNGLNEPEHPDWGGWAGRYVRTVSPEGAPIWDGGTDEVRGSDGKLYRSPQAGLWRWRPDFQHDFAARMEWTTDAFENCSHPPVVRLDQPKVLRVRPGETVELDAGASESPDGVPLSFRWFWYPEAGMSPIRAELTATEGPRTTVTCVGGGSFHLILAATGARKYPLCRYRRIVVKCSSKANAGRFEERGGSS